MPWFAYLLIYILIFALGSLSGFFLNAPICGMRRNRRAVSLISGVFAILSWTAFMPPIAFLAYTLLPRYAEVSRILYGYPGASVILYFVVLSCLLAIAVIDQRTMEIPDSLSIVLAVCGLFVMFFGPDIGPVPHLIGIVVASVPLFVIALFVEGAFGFGDVKLMAAAGFLLGWQNCLVALFTGIVIGGVYGAFLLATKKKGRKEHFAFGPALCVGIGIAMFAGDHIAALVF